MIPFAWSLVISQLAAVMSVGQKCNQLSHTVGLVLKEGGGGNVYLCTITNVTEVHPSVKYQYPVNVKGFTSDFI